MDLIRDFADQGRLIVFAGAGVSMSPPTCLPSWWDIHKAVAEALAERTSELVGGPRSRQLAANIVSRQRAEKFPPEYQAELIAARLPETYFDVLRCLDSTQPNPTHRAFVALAQSRKLKAIVTTNFDRAIEAAFSQAGVPLVVHTREQEFAALAADLTRFAQAETPCQLLKIHGSADDPATLVDTLAQRKRGWSPPVHACIRHLLRSGHWLFVGYSGADLAAEPNYLHLRGDVAEACGFTWLVRETTEPLAPVKELKEAYGRRAEIRFGELPGWMTAVVESVGTQYRVDSADAADLNPDLMRADTERRVGTDVRVWAESQRLDRCALVMADLLTATNQPDAALEVLQRLHDATPATERASKHFGVVLNGLANVHQARGDFDRALALFDQTLAMFDPQDWPEQSAGVMTNMALALQRQGHTRRAVDRLNEALRLLERVENSAARAVTLNNLALAESTLGAHDDAIRHLQQELELLRTLGDEPGRGQALNDLGEILIRKGSFDEASAYLRESCDIHARLGDEYRSAHALGSLANVHFWKGDLAEARRLYEAVRQIFEHFADTPKVVTAIGNIASVAVQQERFEEAVALMQQALELSEKSGKSNSAERVRLCQKLGAIHTRQGRVLEAIGSLETARALHRELELPLLHRTCLLELGIAYRDANRLDDAEACLREALALSERQPPDRDHGIVVEQLALLLNLLGLAAQEQRRFEDALSRFEESARLLKACGSLTDLTGALKNIANTHWLAGAPDQALAACSEALSCADRDADQSEAIELLCTKAEMEVACGRIDDALRDYADAWARCAGPEEREYVRDRLGDLAARCASGFHPHFALDLYRACLGFNEQTGNETGVAAVQFNIAALLMHLGRPAEALPLLRRAAETFARHGHAGAENTRALLARCEADLTRLSGASEPDAE